MRSVRFTALTLGLLFTLTGSAAAEPAPWQGVHRPRLVLGTAPEKSGVREVGADGAEWAFPGGIRLVASPGATLVILKGSQRLNLGHGKVPAYSVALMSGEVRVRVPDAKKGALIVAAPRKVIAVVAEGQTSVVAGDQVAVANAEGRTSVAVGAQRHRALDEGTVVAVSAQGETRRALIASPERLDGKTVLVSFGGAQPFAAFDWAPVPEATAYRFEVRKAASQELVLKKELAAPHLPEGAVSVEPGGYIVRVTAVDATGVESVRPLERAVRVVQVTLPEGGYRDATGAVRFPRGTKLGLTHTEGVEMAYGSARDYVAAPSELELLRAEPRLVRLRASADEPDAKLLLLPRNARAEVEFGSRAPRWPGHSLPIRVRLKEAGGGDVPSWIEARPKVTVGVEPVDVAFTRDGAWLTGALPPQPGPGPWVVRVEVADQHGFELGRDFVEISEVRAAPTGKKKPSEKSAAARSNQGS